LLFCPQEAGVGTEVAVRVAVDVLVGGPAVLVRVGVLVRMVIVPLGVGVGVLKPLPEGPADDHQLSPDVTPAAQTLLSMTKMAAVMPNVSAPRPANTNAFCIGDRCFCRGFSFGGISISPGPQADADEQRECRTEGAAELGRFGPAPRNA
jgi:hypothetical protein